MLDGARHVTTSRNINTEQEREMLVKFIASQKIPFHATISDGRKRTTEQNQLQRLWVGEIAAQRDGEEGAEYYRGYCKLHFGVPILRAENEKFRVEYDDIFKPLPYETKIRLMMEPFDFAVTRLMNVGQKSRYLEEVVRHWAEQGLILTQPESKP